MADFRKWLFAFAVLALMLGASTANAQIPGGGGSVVCGISPANPTIVSQENISALVGDFVLVCTGGTPTPTGSQIPQDNITLTLNQNITSRLLAGGYIDALLTIDEPYPTAGLGGTPNPSAPAPQKVNGSPTGQRVCFSVTGGAVGNASSPTGCNVINGLFNPATFLFSGNPYDPAGPNGAGAYNVFVAHATANTGQVTWLGVPIDAPGTAGSRVIRMTNIRANACGAGLSGGLVPTAITGVVSFNGGQTVLVQQNSQTLAFVQQGLLVSSTNASLVQCNNLNVGGIGGIGGNFPASSKVGAPVFAVKLTEGYAASFKRKTAAFLPSVITDVNDANNTSPLPQNVPGFNYNSESGFEPAAGFGAATQGDRFLLVFNNVPTGVNLWVPQYVALTINGTGVPGSPVPGNGAPVNPGAGGWTGGWLELVASSSDLNGNITSVAPTSTAAFNNTGFGTAANPFFAVSPFSGPGSTVGGVTYAAGPFLNAVALSGTGSVFTAVYEVANADPFAPEAANIPIGVSFVSNTAQSIPAAGQSTVTASFAPLSTDMVASATDSIPRWCNRSTATNAFKINVCTCDLLFPFITNSAGFDTGIAIANTTLDPYGTTPQQGTITLNFYGSLPGTPAPAPITPQVSASVAAGTELIFTLSSGGDHGITSEVGFTGYMIAIAQFQFCHGFAFISDLGAQKLAEGYLAIQLDAYGGSGLNRTGILGEVQGH